MGPNFCSVDPLAFVPGIGVPLIASGNSSGAELWCKYAPLLCRVRVPGASAADWCAADCCYARSGLTAESHCDQRMMQARELVLQA